jgi:uncharacterized protein (DUF58 family)
MDFRDYVPGDDLRHVDWRGYARTDQIRVRLFREEVSMALDVVVDLSPSMGSTAAKARALRDLADAAAHWTRRAGGRPRLLAMGGPVLEDAAGSGRFDGSAGFEGPVEPDLPRAPLRPGSLRMWISDFLWEGDPAPLLRRLARGAAQVYVLQLLDPLEIDPAAEGAVTLVDCERDERLDLDVDARAVARYRARLSRLRGAVEAAARGAGGLYALVPAAEPSRMFRDALLPQRVVEPA